MANQQVCFRPRRHRRQTLQELQRLEDQLARPVAPRPLQLERDAPVAPQPQALLREGRPQNVAAQTFPPRPIVRRHPHVEDSQHQRPPAAVAPRVASGWQRLLGGQRLIMGRYVRGPGTTRGAGGAGGRSC